MQRIFLFILLTVWVNFSFAQVILSASVERDTMEIAEDNTYHLRLEHGPGIKILSIDLAPLQTDPVSKALEAQDTITYDDPNQKAMMEQRLEQMLQEMGISRQIMEIKSAGNWTLNPEMKLSGENLKWTTEKDGNLIVKTNAIQFTFWENGITAILAPIIEYEQNGETKTTTTAEIEVFVRDPLAKATVPIDSLNVQPNKEIIEEPIDWVQDILIPVGLFLLGAGLLAWLIYFLLKRKKKAIPTIEPPQEIIPASVIAMEKLQKLRAEKIWQQGKIKAYQSQLTYAIREYLENRYDINALENTTFQIGQDLKKLNLKEALRNDLQNILQVADLVKFAKAQPDENVHAQFLTKAEEFVQTTKKTTAQIEAEKAEQETAYAQALEDLKKGNTINQKK